MLTYKNNNMKQFYLKSFFLSLLMVVFGNVGALALDTWVATAPGDLAEGDVVVIVDLNDEVAMPNDGGGSSAPAATKVELSDDKTQITGTVGDNLQWTVKRSGDVYQFYATETTWLYCTTSNNGVRVGANSNKNFNIVADPNNNHADFLFNTDQSCYLGVYISSGTAQDWRRYSSINANIKGTVTKFYKKVESAAGIAINETNFPDNAFRTWVSENCDTGDKDGYLSDEEIAAQNSWIILSNKNIEDLKGIEYFTAVKSLMCDNNKLTSLDVSKNTALGLLHCTDNQLTSLDVSNNTELTTLLCQNNKLTSLDVSENQKLTILDCSNNLINETEMGKLVASMPTLSGDGVFYPFNLSVEDANVISTTQVDEAKGKNWKVQAYNGEGIGYVDYDGVEPTPETNEYYEKVTTAPSDWSGEYLIVYEEGSVAFNGGLSTLDAVGNTIEVVMNDNKIEATEETDAAAFTIAKNADGAYTIKSASGKYIGVSSNSNGLKQTDNASTYTHNLSIDDDENAVIKAAFSGSNMSLRYNEANNQTRFRYYKEGQKAIQLYKKVTTTTNQYTLVAGTEEYPFEGLTLTKELPAQTDFYIKDGTGKEYHSTDAQSKLTIIAENHENLPTSAEGENFYLSKANTWVFTLTEGEGGAVTLTVSPQTAGETKYMLSSDYHQESDDVFDANNQLTKELTKDGFYITRTDDYGITNLTAAESNVSDYYIWEFSDDAETVGYIPGKIINVYRVSKAGSYTFTLDLDNKTLTAEFISGNQYTLVAGTEEYPFEGLTLTKALPEHTQFYVKDSNENVFHSTDTQTQLIINAENHENLPTSAEGNDFYLSKANTWVFTLTEGEGGAVTLTVNPETPGATQYMLSETYLTASDAIFDASYKLTKEMTTDEFYIVRSDDYGLTNLTPANFNAPEDRRYWIFSEDAPTVEFITGEIRGSYTVAEAGLYNITLDLTNNKVTAEKAPDVRTAMFCNEFFGYEAGTAAQKDESKFEGDADGVTIVVNKGTSTTKMFVSDSELRVYNGNSMSFTAPNGFDITKIVFTPTTNGDWKGSVTTNVDTFTDNTRTWEGKSETVVFSIGASNRLTKAEITLAPGKQSAALKYAVDEYRTETESGEVADAPELTKAEGYDGTITYTSSDEGIATVDAQTGTVTAAAVGDVTITATGTETDTYNGGTASYLLHIGYLDAQMKFAKDAVTVLIGGSVENTLTKKTSAEVAYASDNEAVASVDAAGNVTVKAVGSATITATAEKADPYKAGEVSYTITVEDKKGSEFGSKSCFYEPFDFDGGTGGNDGQFKGNVASSNFDTNYTGTNTWTVKPSLGFNCARAGTGSLKGSATVSSIAVEAGKTYHLNFKAAPFNEERTVMDVTVEGGTIDGLSTETMAKFQWNDLSATIKATADELTLTFTADQNRFFLDEIRLADPTDLNTASVTIPASGWASYCCEYPIEFTDNGDVKAYAVTKVSGNKATLTQVTGTIKGGVPLFINGAAGEHPLTVAEHSTNEVDGNLLKGTLSPTYVAGETSEAINYGLKSGELHAIVSGTMPAGKAYLPIAKNVAPAGSKLSLVFEDATGINQYQNIQADGIFYDLQGRRVGNPQKGIYVRNGKKVVIK